MPDFTLNGEIDPWPTKTELAALLEASGLKLILGPYSIRLASMDHFVFRNYGGDKGSPQLSADASTLESLTHDAQQVSAILTAARLRHRFELYDDSENLVQYLHYKWPQRFEFTRKAP